MGLTVPLQWMTGLYRGALNGFERQVWLAGFNASIAVVRFAGAAVVILLRGGDPINFFSYQLVVSVIELLILVWMGRRVLPAVERSRRRFIQWREARELLKFSGSLAFAVLAWTLVTQVDKLVLSKVLSLADYGLFSLAVIAAGGLLLLSGPVAQALLPRLTRMVAEGGERSVIELYRRGAEFVCLATVPATLTLAFFAKPVLLVWTGDLRVADAVAPILTPYALGNGVMTLGAFPYYLQFARGDLRLHVIGNGLLIAILIPSIALAAIRFGAIGAGYAWLGVNVIYMALWLPLVHRRLAPGLHIPWLTQDILPIAAAAALAAWLISLIAITSENRLVVAAFLGATGILVLGAAIAASPVARGWLIERTHRTLGRDRRAVS